MEHYNKDTQTYRNPPPEEDLPAGEGPHVRFAVARDQDEPVWLSVDLPLELLPQFYWAALWCPDREGARSWTVEHGELMAELSELGYTLHGAVGPRRERNALAVWQEGEQTAMQLVDARLAEALDGFQG